MWKQLRRYLNYIAISREPHKGNPDDIWGIFHENFLNVLVFTIEGWEVEMKEAVGLIEDLEIESYEQDTMSIKELKSKLEGKVSWSKVEKKSKVEAVENLKFSDRAKTYINSYLEMFHNEEYVYIPDGDFGKAWIYFTYMFMPVFVERRGDIYDEDWAKMNKLLEKYEIKIDPKQIYTDLQPNYKVFDEQLLDRVIEKREKRIYSLIEYVLGLEKKYRIKELAHVEKLVFKPGKRV